MQAQQSCYNLLRPWLRACAHNAMKVLAFCDMRTLYIRNVPEEVADRLDRLAAREGLSVSAFVARELASLSLRVDNAALLGDLPNLGVEAAEVLAILDSGRPN
jgi:hypothetical protein